MCKEILINASHARMRCLGKEKVYEDEGNEGGEAEDELHDAPRGVVCYDTYQGESRND
jgi:hypothetical protein